MNTTRGWITTIFLLGTLMLSTTATHAGVIYGGLNDSGTGTCGEPTKSNTVKAQALTGVIYGGLTGIIFGGLTGIIYGGLSKDEPPQNCGVIYGG